MNNLLLGIGIGVCIVAQLWLHMSICAHKKRFKEFQEEMRKQESGTKKAWKSFMESR